MTCSISSNQMAIANLQNVEERNYQPYKYKIYNSCLIWYVQAIFYEMFAQPKCDCGNCRNLLSHYYDKIRESSVFASKVCRELISRKSWWDCETSSTHNIQVWQNEIHIVIMVTKWKRSGKFLLLSLTIQNFLWNQQNG